MVLALKRLVPWGLLAALCAAPLLPSSVLADVTATAQALPAAAASAPSPASTPAVTQATTPVPAAAAPLSATVQAPAAAVAPAATPLPALPLPEIQEQAAPAAEQPSVQDADDAGSSHLWTNFLLGFTGGALVGAAYGILFNTSTNLKIRNLDTGLYAAGGGLAFGTIAMFLGATTPPQASSQPPQVQSRRFAPGVQVAFKF